MLEAIGLGAKDAKGFNFVNPVTQPKAWMEESEKNLNEIWEGIKGWFKKK